MLDSLLAYAELKLGPTWGPAAYELVTSLVFIVAIVVPLMLCGGLPDAVGAQADRLDADPHRAEPRRSRHPLGGLLQPIADGIKLLFKEVILPANANKVAVRAGADR